MNDAHVDEPVKQSNDEEDSETLNDSPIDINKVQQSSIEQLSESFSNTMNELINAHNTMKEEIKKLVKDNEALKAENKRLKDKLNRIKESINEIVNA